MKIDIVYDTSVALAPDGFKAAFQYAASALEDTFTNAVTIKVAVGWGAVNGQGLKPGTLGTSLLNSGPGYTYSQIHDALVTAGASSVDAVALTHLPDTDPTGGGTFAIGRAAAKALGLLGPSNAIDGWIGFSSTTGAFSFDPADRAVAGEYDFIGVAFHELTHVMGRIAGLNPLGYSLLDLFRYSSVGERQLVETSSAYFSLDGGATNLDSFNSILPGNVADWAASAGHDAFLAFSSPGVQNDLTALDLDVMDAIGWNTSTGSPIDACGDAYIVAQDDFLTTGTAVTVLVNDVNATTATLARSPMHGSLQFSGDGSFSYTPVTGFHGIDSFAYQAGNGGSPPVGEVLLYVVPTQGTPSPTLNLLALTAEEQIAVAYTAFFSRAADAAGFAFWLNQFNAGLPKQGAAVLFANIASSFGVSDEAIGMYSFLANPQRANDVEIRTFLDAVYDNLFNRSTDAAGLAYWVGQIKQTLESGQYVGSVLFDVISGTQVGPDMTALMGKVAVGLEFVHQQEVHQTEWNAAIDQAAATALLQAINSNPQTVLVGIKQADTIVAEHA